MISVLVVEDSRVERQLLLRVLERDPELRVVAIADNGAEAVELAELHKPDIVTMDLMMPRMNGYDATRAIMESTPTPVVVVSGEWGCEEVGRMSKAFEAGAIAGVRKPRSPEWPEHGDLAKELVRTLKLYANVKVVRRWRRDRGRRPGSLPTVGPLDPLRAVAVGVSTGGPPVLERILGRLPASFPAPVLVVQHIADGFVRGLVEWLRREVALGVQLASHGERAHGGQVYLAPDGRHMGVDSKGRILLVDAPLENGHRPAVSHLFRSVDESLGAHAAGVLLTGMGRDGARELGALRSRGAITIAQDEDSCTVFGMPGEAIRQNAAQHVLAPGRIGDLLCRLTGVERRSAPTGTRRHPSPPRSGRDDERSAGTNER